MLLPVWFERFLSVYVHILSLFGLRLPCEEYVNWKRHETMKKYLVTLLSALLLLGYGYLQWFGSENIYRISRTSNVILLSAADTLITLICVMSTLGNIFWNKERWSQYMKLKNISRKRLQIEIFWRNRIYLVLEIVLGHLLFVFVVGISPYRNIVAKNSCIDDMKLTIANLIKDIMYYYIFLTATVIYNTALDLRYSFAGLKSYLIRSLNMDRNIPPSKWKRIGRHVPHVQITGDGSFFKLLEASKIFNILFESVEIFNKIFGVIILFFNVATVLIILVSLNTLLISAETEQLTVDVAIDSISGIIMIVTWNSFVISACALLKQESILLINLCCKLQHCLPHTSKERQELLNLARQISRKSPRVSAAGFFNVDFSLIVSVFSCVGTYIVVLIQFSHIEF